MDVAVNRLPAARRSSRSRVLFATAVCRPPAIHSPGRGSSRLQFCRGAASPPGAGEVQLLHPPSGLAKVSSRGEAWTLAAHTSGGGFLIQLQTATVSLLKRLICFSSAFSAGELQDLGLAALQGCLDFRHRGSLGVSQFHCALHRDRMGLSLRESSTDVHGKERKAGRQLWRMAGRRAFRRVPGAHLFWSLPLRLSLLIWRNQRSLKRAVASQRRTVGL